MNEFHSYLHCAENTLMLMISIDKSEVFGCQSHIICHHSISIFIVIIIICMNKYFSYFISKEMMRPVNISKKEKVFNALR